jgi:hypothetical protein
MTARDEDILELTGTMRDDLRAVGRLGPAH